MKPGFGEVALVGLRCLGIAFHTEDRLVARHDEAQAQPAGAAEEVGELAFGNEGDSARVDPPDVGFVFHAAGKRVWQSSAIVGHGRWIMMHATEPRRQPGRAAGNRRPSRRRSLGKFRVSHSQTMMTLQPRRRRERWSSRSRCTLRMNFACQKSEFLVGS